jgi:hypothetical protein
MTLMKQTLCFLFFFMSLSARAEDVTAIIKKADEARMPGGDLTVDVLVKDFKNKTLDKETVYKVSNKGSTKSLVETMSPQRQKGRKLLVMNSDLWFMTPDIKRATRVSFQQRLTGEVSNGDIASVNFADDYAGTLVGSEKIKDQDCWVIDLKAINERATYRSLKYWVVKGTYLPKRADFYAISGKLLKRATYGKPATILGSPRITTMVIQDAVQTSSESVIEYSNHKRAALDDSMFNKDNLAP